MKKCKQCGAVVTTKFCGNCGAKVEEANEQQTAQSMDMGGLFNVLNEQLGTVLSDPNFMKNMQAFMVAMPGMNQQGSPFAFSTDKQPKQGAKQSAKQNDEARLAILNNICPACATDFSAKEEKCKKCGASLLLEDYR